MRTGEKAPARSLRGTGFAWSSRRTVLKKPTPTQIAHWQVALEGYTGSDRHGAFRMLWLAYVDGNTLQTCQEAVEALVVLCDDLTPVRGQVVMTAAPDGDTRPWPHWWAVDAEGQVVDPTADQFPSPLEYRAADESRGGPTGKCPNCGGLCYNGRTVCSDQCGREYVAYLNAPISW